MIFRAFLLLMLALTPSWGQNTPNIILIMADDMGYEVLGSSGGTSYATPHLDQLASQGVRFTHAYAMPLCTPSRVQIMTGKYNFRNYERFGYLNPKERTFANLLQDTGYQTAIAGKWQLEGGEEAPAHFGFDKYCLWQIRSGDFWYRYKNPVIYQNGEKRKDTQGGYGPEVFTEFILNFMQQAAEEEDPFLVYYPMCLVHDPFQPTPNQDAFETYEIEGLNDTTYFRDMVSFMDQQVGRIAKQVETLGIQDNTLILFTGDNGTDRDVVSWMGSRRVPGMKGLPVDAGTHVPLIAHWAGQPGQGRVVDDLIDFTDVLPTLLEAAQVEKPADFVTDGRSFLPQITDQKGSPREWIYCDYNSGKSQFPVVHYAQDHQYKLYGDSTFYHFAQDLNEQHPLNLENLSQKEMKHYQKLKSVIKEYESQKAHP
uniref:Sulfatase-like hydrolase/transferase n=1 Tax=Roseihalotalea indica TaxID=2867963 RepID=A0AA49GHA7_9BACT|nr:sulfatase-like hydrolase/transferase [Tunicatimonas sp. TK19036]